MTDWNKLIGIFLMFTVIDSVASYLDYVVAKVGGDPLIELHINSSRIWDVAIGINIYERKMLFDQDLKFYNTKVEERIKNLQRLPDGRISFILKNVTLQDAGGVLLVEGTERLKILVTARPEIGNITTTPAVVGKSMVMTCNAKSRTQPPYHSLTMSYIWQTNWQPLPSDDHMTAGNLTIHNVSLKHQGDTYRCQARENRGYNSSWSGEITLDVQYGPLGITFHPTGDKIEVMENHDINVNCSSRCKPECNLELTWEGEITQGQRKGHVTMFLATAKRRMTGSILCTARNKHGNKSRTRTLDIVYPPTIQSITGNVDAGKVEVTVGDSLVVEGVVDANPIPKARLTGGYNRVVDLEFGPIKKDNYSFSLLLSNLTHQDHSNFTVTANNTYGRAQLRFQVKVKMAPLEIPSPIKLHECGDTLCWEFCILAYPEPTLQKSILFRPNKASIQLYVEPSHTELKENLHEYTMKFRGPDYRGQYVFQFRNDVGVRNVTFDLFEANSQKATAPVGTALVTIIVVCTVVVIVIIIGVTIYCIKSRRQKSGERHRRSRRVRHNRRSKKDEYSVVKKRRRPGDVRSLIANIHDQPRRNNCGERNNDGIIYADLELSDPPVSESGDFIVFRRDPPVQYMQIDFTLMPAPKVPPKIWEIENDEA